MNPFMHSRTPGLHDIIEFMPLAPLAQAPLAQASFRISLLKRQLTHHGRNKGEVSCPEVEGARECQGLLNFLGFMLTTEIARNNAPRFIKNLSNQAMGCRPRAKLAKGRVLPKPASPLRRALSGCIPSVSAECSCVRTHPAHFQPGSRRALLGLVGEAARKAATPVSPLRCATR